MHNVLLYCIVLYCIILYCIVLYCIVLYCIVLYCIVLTSAGSLVVIQQVTVIARAFVAAVDIHTVGVACVCVLGTFIDICITESLRQCDCFFILAIFEQDKHTRN